jgi:hypothetical protein
MSNVVSQGFAPATLDEAMKFSEMLARSSMVPRAYQNKAEDILVACQWGREIGLAPMQALQNIAVINGKPSVYGDAAMALVQASAVCDGIEESFENEDTMSMVAVCVAHRKNRKPVVARFSIADAQRAGLWNKQGPWTAYPKRMLQMRARGFALRDAFPDVLKGLITAEEAQDYPSDQPAKDITPANPLDALPAPHVDAVNTSAERVDVPTKIEHEPQFNGTWSPDIEEPETVVVNEPETVEVEVVAEPEPNRSWTLHIPGKPEQTFATQQEWSDNYEEICAKVMAAKLEPAAKGEKLEQLKNANAAEFKRMDIDRRLSHTQAYAKRRGELGFG